MQSKAKKWMRLMVCTAACVTATWSYAENQHAIFTPADIKWAAGPDSLPKGVEVAVLEGDPSKAGPFTIRLKMPANYRIPPHMHPTIEHVTTITGAINIGMGDKFDEKLAKELPAGSFGYMDIGMHHFAFTKQPTTIQLHGQGPWGISYINPQDDPRNQKK